MGRSDGDIQEILVHVATAPNGEASMASNVYTVAAMSPLGPPVTSLAVVVVANTAALELWSRMSEFATRAAATDEEKQLAAAFADDVRRIEAGLVEAKAKSAAATLFGASPAPGVVS